jgi:TonB family protein
MSLLCRNFCFRIIAAGLVCAAMPARAQITGTASNPTQVGALESSPPSDSKALDPIKIVRPVYPDEARAQKLEGHVVVKITVTVTGDVDETEQASGDPILGAACADALKQWKFHPFIRNGKPTRVSANLPCDFTLPELPPVVPVEEKSSALTNGTRGTGGETPARVPNTVAGGDNSSPAQLADSKSLIVVKKVKPSYPLEAGHSGRSSCRNPGNRERRCRCIEGG